MAKATIRTPMPVSMRAKQFMMFDAMKGLTEAIADREHSVYSKVILSKDGIEEFDQMLHILKSEDVATVMYYR